MPLNPLILRAKPQQPQPAQPKPQLQQTQAQQAQMANLIEPIEILRLEVLSSLEKYTRAIFKAQYKKSFLMAEHFKRIFKALEEVVDGKTTRLIINMPPRYGKTEVVVKSFISWCFALNPRCRFLHLSYSDMLVNDNSATIRAAMVLPLFKQLFPGTTLERERGASNWWKTKEGGEFYAVSTQGQVTGFGAGEIEDESVSQESDTFENMLGGELGRLLDLIGASRNIFSGALIIDDPLKPEDALSDTVRERINQRFENTIRNRTNSRHTPIIIIMQRLHEHDLCGYLQAIEPDDWTILSIPAIVTKEDGEERALWEVKHTIRELRKMRDINTLVFDTQYMQDPKPKEGLMYSSGFRTYDLQALNLLSSFYKRANYTDTADTGADMLCSICFIDTPEFAYVTDVLYTDKPMEITEPAVAQLLNLNSVQICKIEANNGGRGFARAVSRHLLTDYNNRRVHITTFSQTNNKYVRIFTRSAEVQNVILFPVDWDKRWPSFHKALTSYRKDNRRRSQLDDAADCVTGVIEMRGAALGKRRIKQKN